MEHKKITARRVNINYSAIQGLYWMGTTPFMQFAAVFLQFRGLTNTQIGFSMSVSAIGAIITQTVLSNFSDKRPDVPLKLIVTMLYLIILGASTVLTLVPYSIAIIMIVFIIGQASVTSTNSLLSAMFMQMQNAGLRVNFGVPRGIGSISFAILVYWLGGAVEKYSPEILFPFEIGLSIIAIIAILLMPRPESISGVHPDQVNVDRPRKIKEMLKENPTFVMLLVSMVFSATGLSYFGFFINIIRRAGGDAQNLGMVMFMNAALELLPMFFSAFLLRKFGAKNLVIVALTAFFIKSFTVSLVHTVVGIYVTTLTSLLSNGIFFYAIVYFVNDIVKPNERTRGQALAGLCSFGGLGAMIGSTVCGSLLDKYGIDAMMIFCNTMSFIGVMLMIVTSKLHKKYFLTNK